MSRSSAANTAAAGEPKLKPIARIPLKLPPWAQERVVNWHPTPVGRRHLLSLLTPTANNVLDILVFESQVQNTNSPALKQAALANELGCHTDTIQEAIDELDRIGAIRKHAKLADAKRKKDHSRFVYELLVADWPKLKPLPKPEAAEPEAAEPEAAEPEAAEPEAAAPIAVPKVELARNESKPIPIPATAAAGLKAYRCQNRSDFPISLDAKLANGCLSIDIFVEKTEVVSRSPGKTTVLFPDLRQMLNRLLSRDLGLVHDEDLQVIGNALDRCPIEQLEHRILQRRSMFTGGKGTWGGVLLLAQGCAKAFAAASEVPTSAQPAEPESPNREEEYRAHCNDLAERWLDRLSPLDRLRMLAAKTREIKRQYAAAQFWPAEQIREQAEALLRGEALKRADVPTYEDFCAAAPKAKGAGA